MAQYSQRTQPMHSQYRWLKVIGRPDLLKKTDLKPLSYKICSVHFENSIMSEVLTRKLLPGAVPTKLLSTKSSTSVKGSKSSEQTKHPYKKELSVVKMKNASTMTMVHTQTVSLTNERETQTSSPLSSGTKRRLITQLQESEKKKRRLQHELERPKKETDAKNSLSRSPSGQDDDDVTETLFNVSVMGKKSIMKKRIDKIMEGVQLQRDEENMVGT